MKSDQEILTKAIKKAIAGGCTYFDTEHFLVKHYVEGMEEEPAEWPSVNDIIFNHDFAKALWGEEPKVIIGNADDYPNGNEMPKWQYHLQQMVVADDPIKYMGKNI